MFLVVFQNCVKVHPILFPLRLYNFLYISDATLNREECYFCTYSSAHWLSNDLKRDSVNICSLFTYGEDEMINPTLNADIMHLEKCKFESHFVFQNYVERCDHTVATWLLFYRVLIKTVCLQRHPSVVGDMCTCCEPLAFGSACSSSLHWKVNKREKTFVGVYLAFAWRDWKKRGSL